MSEKPLISLNKFVKKLEAVVKKAVDNATMDKLGEFTLNLVVKRTRLGYGVDKPFGQKEPFAKLSPNYILARRKQKGLDSTTKATKSNLTRSGQMIKSFQSKSTRSGTVIIRATGKRDDGRSNEDVSGYAIEGSAKRPQRIWNNVSQAEFNQLMRYYRKTFGDLVKSTAKGKLIR